jgi:hypothetical protein
MKIRFASLQHPDKYGYAYDTDSWTSMATVDTHFRQYQTFGDGQCQHSGDSAITVEFMADYLASLAVVMLTDEVLTKELRYLFSGGPSVSSLEFCASVIFKPVSDESAWEKKTRYYSVELKQISSTESKRHDNRFHKLEKWNDGTAGAIFTMLAREYESGFDKYQRAHMMHDWFRNMCAARSDAYPKVYMDLPGVFLNWFKDPDGPGDRARQLRDAYDACASIGNAFSMRAQAMGNLRNYRLSIGRPAEEEAA